MIFKLVRITVVGVYLIFLLGFRTFDDKKTFAVDNSSPAKAKIFIDFDQAAVTLENDLPGEDVLFGTSPLTVATAIQSVMSDYNTIGAAYVQLVDTSDPDYAAESTNRIITIRKETTDGLTSGEAKLEFSGNQVIGCRIDLNSKIYEKAKGFIATVTHEIGHCLGLDHPQETIHAVMSYFSQDIVRLQIDDKMGIVYLYPINPSRAKEKATFGASCSRSE